MPSLSAYTLLFSPLLLILSPLSLPMLFAGVLRYLHFSGFSSFPCPSISLRQNVSSRPSAASPTVFSQKKNKITKINPNSVRLPARTSKSTYRSPLSRHPGFSQQPLTPYHSRIYSHPFGRVFRCLPPPPISPFFCVLWVVYFSTICCMLTLAKKNLPYHRNAVVNWYSYVQYKNR